MATVSGIVYIIGANAVTFQIFLIWTDIDILWLTVIMIAVIAFGFYMSDDVVRMVRSVMCDVESENAYLKAVRIWVETLVVFCRMAELIGNLYKRNIE